MNVKLDTETIWLVGGVLALLIIASVLGQILRMRIQSEQNANTILNLNARIKAWWMMVAVFGLAMLTGGIGSVILFGLTSFLALREFITLTPTRPGDHRTLFRVFFLSSPRSNTGSWLLVGMDCFLSRFPGTRGVIEIFFSTLSWSCRSATSCNMCGEKRWDGTK